MSIHEPGFLRKSTPVDNSGITQKRPPYNLEAEQALLGALLLSNQAAEYVPDLTPDHFFDGLHSRIFAAISDELLRGRIVSPVTLAERFRADIVSADLNGAQYLGRLAAEATSIRNVRDYARTIIDCSQRRTLIVLAEDLADRAFDPNDLSSPAELIEMAERRLFQTSTAGKSGLEVEYGDAIRQALNSANTARMNGGGLTGLSTGFADLDARLGGLASGNLVIIAGRPSMGKTALAMNIAGNIAQTGDFVHFFSMEMSPEELANRQLGEFSGVSSNRLRRGDFTEQEFRSIADAARRLSGLPCVIDRTGGITIASLAAKARRMKRKRQTKLIVIDYLQLMSAGAGKGGNRVQDITEITTGLKALAADLQIPIIALSQLSRAVESRIDKRPMLSDLRESGSIEQDADVVMFVYREEYYLERTKPDASDMMATMDWENKMRAAYGKAEIILGKQRHGAVGVVPMAFEGELTRFSDLARGNAP